MTARWSEATCSGPGRRSAWPLVAAEELPPCWVPTEAAAPRHRPLRAYRITSEAKEPAPKAMETCHKYLILQASQASSEGDQIRANEQATTLLVRLRLRADELVQTERVTLHLPARDKVLWPGRHVDPLFPPRGLLGLSRRLNAWFSGRPSSSFPVGQGGSIDRGCWHHGVEVPQRSRHSGCHLRITTLTSHDDGRELQPVVRAWLCRRLRLHTPSALLWDPSLLRVADLQPPRSIRPPPLNTRQARGQVAAAGLAKVVLPGGAPGDLNRPRRSLLHALQR